MQIMNLKYFIKMQIKTQTKTFLNHHKIMWLLRKLSNAKFHNHSSLIYLLVVVPALLWSFPPAPEQTMEARISILKKKSGEEVLSLYGKQLKNIKGGPIIMQQGYIVYDYNPSENSHLCECNTINEIPNPKSTVLLDNLQNKCVLSQRLNLAYRAGYTGVIFFNYTHLNLQQENLYRIKGLTSIAISNENAHTLMKFAFPSSVRFYIELSTWEGISRFLQPLNLNDIPILRSLMVFKSDQLWILNLQGFLHGFIFFLIWRWCLVPKEFSIWRFLYQMIYPPGPYFKLECDNNKTKTSLEQFITKIFKCSQQQSNNYNNSYFDIQRVIHHPFEIRVIQEDFETNCAVGYGSFGKVTEEIFKRTGEKVAMKRVLKLESVSILEADILACGNCCDGIVKLLYGFVSDLHVNFVMEIMIGSLTDFIKDFRIHHARIYTVELGLALETLHSFGICHRDLKPSNIMLDTKYHIKLGDFGCARKFDQGETLITEENYIGTEPYWSPENYKKQWALESDWWAFGCIVFELFSRGNQYFLNSKYMHKKLKDDDYNDDITNRRIAQGIPSSTPTEVRSLLRRCLSKNPFRRPFNKSKSGKIIRFSDQTSFASIPIPVKQSVNILDEFKLNSGKLPEWEHVPESISNVRDQVEQFKINEDICRIIQTFQDEDVFENFYFDHQDTNCYRNNSVIGEYFHQ